MEMYIKKEGCCRISIEKKRRFYMKKEGFSFFKKKKVERKKKEKRRKCTHPNFWQQKKIVKWEFQSPVFNHLICV